MFIFFWIILILTNLINYNFSIWGKIFSILQLLLIVFLNQISLLLNKLIIYNLILNYIFFLYKLIFGWFFLFGTLENINLVIWYYPNWSCRNLAKFFSISPIFIYMLLYNIPNIYWIPLFLHNPFECFSSPRI